MHNPDRIQLACAKYISRYDDGEKITIVESWNCSGNDQGISGEGKTPQEAIGWAILGLVDAYKDMPTKYVIGSIHVQEEPITMPIEKVKSGRIYLT